MLAVWIWGLQAMGSAGSLAVGRPWTSLASGRRYEPQVRAHPLFAQANRRITAAWTAYFAAAAGLSALAGPLASLALAVPTPALGWLSYRYGNRFAAERLRRDDGRPPQMADDRQSELRALIDGKSDDEILAAVREASGTYQEFVDITMEGMAEAFEPDAAQECVIGYEIATPDGTLAYRVEVAGQSVSIDQRPPDDARVVLGLSLPDYLRLINGLLDGTQAFLAGKLKLRGDVMFATQIERIFRRG